MAEALRPKPAEYYNPRPLILGVCFFWGIAVGFCLFYFSPPKQLASSQPDQGTQASALPGQLSELERRNQDVPVIAEVDVSSERETTAASATPTLETMDLDPPGALLTTEGGLNGKMARPLRPVSAGAGTATTITETPAPGSAPPPAMAAPPPIPELLP